MLRPLYMDYHATTPCDARVVEAMLPYFLEEFGNAASTGHPYGWRAKEAVEAARGQVAALAGAEPGEVVFTSGATEAINMVLQGVAYRKEWRDVHVVTCVTEHAATLDTCRFLETRGARVTYLPVDGSGHIDLDELGRVLESRPALVSVLHANNEIGVVHPIEEIAQMCVAAGTLLHVDAAQSLGKIPVRFREWQVDFLSVSSHKIYGPKGAGALLVRRRIPPIRIAPLMYGGGHERGLRSGTVNVPGVVGLGAAAEICTVEMEAEQVALREMRDALLAGLREAVPGLVVNGDLMARLAANLNVSLPGIDGTMLLPTLRERLSVSSGSACHSANQTPSHVLRAIGRSDEEAFSSLRFGVGRFTKPEDIWAAVEITAECYRALRTA